jgi:N-succinyldiaminopimelate aminotransferase
VNPYLVERLQPFGTTIFAEMSALAVETGAINLGQGFPDTDGPDVVKQAALDAIRDGHNQYQPGIGIPELRSAIRAHQQRFYALEFDAATEVLVTAGATEAIAAALIALCGPSDEVVTFEPYYDSYAACIAMAGATRRVVTLRTPDYSFDPDELRAAVTSRTKLILLNTPHNPTGKVFSRTELECIAELARERDILVVTDEVYEHLVYDGEHIPIATLPGMRDRTVTIGSGGKSFSFTGWKVGWVTAPSELVTAIKTAKQFLTYVGSGPFQYGIAVGLQMPDAYFTEFRNEMLDKRDRLCAGLAGAGFDVLTPQATYFVTVDIRSFGDTDGLAFCRSLPHRCGVVAVPSVVFYDDAEAGAPFVRFACCKRIEVLDEACTRLKSLAK